MKDQELHSTPALHSCALDMLLLTSMLVFSATYNYPNAPPLPPPPPSFSQDSVFHLDLPDLCSWAFSAAVALPPPHMEREPQP